MRNYLMTRRQHIIGLSSTIGILSIGGCDPVSALASVKIIATSALSAGKQFVVHYGPKVIDHFVVAGITGLIEQVFISPAKAEELKKEADILGVNQEVYIQTASVINNFSLKEQIVEGKKIWYQKNQYGFDSNFMEVTLSNDTKKYIAGQIRVGIFDKKTGEAETVFFGKPYGLYPGTSKTFPMGVNNEFKVYGDKKLVLLDTPKEIRVDQKNDVVHVIPAKFVSKV